MRITTIGHCAFYYEQKEGGLMRIPGVLTVIFILAKLLGLLSWSWLMCFTPLIIYVCIYMLIFAVGFTAGAIDRTKRRSL